MMKPSEKLTLLLAAVLSLTAGGQSAGTGGSITSTQGMYVITSTDGSPTNPSRYTMQVCNPKKHTMNITIGWVSQGMSVTVLPASPTGSVGPLAPITQNTANASKTFTTADSCCVFWATSTISGAVVEVSWISTGKPAHVDSVMRDHSFLAYPAGNTTWTGVLGKQQSSCITITQFPQYLNPVRTLRIGTVYNGAANLEPSYDDYGWAEPQPEVSTLDVSYYRATATGLTKLQTINGESMTIASPTMGKNNSFIVCINSKLMATDPLPSTVSVSWG